MVVHLRPLEALGPLRTFSAYLKKCKEKTKATEANLGSHCYSISKCFYFTISLRVVPSLYFIMLIPFVGLSNL